MTDRKDMRPKRSSAPMSSDDGGNQVRPMMKALAAALLSGSSALALFGGDAAFAADVRPSLCLSDETAIFSCSIRSKIASLCASRDLTATTGTMIYRYGRRGAVEMTYPDPPEPASRAFAANVDNTPGDYVRFSRDGNTYTIHSEMIRSSDPHPEAGVIVSRGPKVLATLKCGRNDDGLGPDAWKLMYEAKLPRDPLGSIDPAAE